VGRTVPAGYRLALLVLCLVTDGMITLTNWLDYVDIEDIKDKIGFKMSHLWPLKQNKKQSKQKI
jgi:hypothetical protein